jgi:site-specific DNA-methyltransferase (adenine-specific)/modification methylase
MQPGKAYSKGIRKDQRTGSYGEFAPVLVACDGERYPTDVIYFPTAESEGAVVHPTQKPLRLMEYLIRTYSHAGETVLDNAMGSGSTGVAALRAGRFFVGIERDPQYFEIACQRIREAEDQLGMVA